MYVRTYVCRNFGGKLSNILYFDQVVLLKDTFQLRSGLATYTVVEQEEPREVMRWRESNVKVDLPGSPVTRDPCAGSPSAAARHQPAFHLLMQLARYSAAKNRCFPQTKLMRTRRWILLSIGGATTLKTTTVIVTVTTYIHLFSRQHTSTIYSIIQVKRVA